MGSLSHVIGTPQLEGGENVADSSYDNGVVRVEQLSETFYAVCFKPESCRLIDDADAYNTLLSACAQAELASSKALNFFTNNLDMGILAMSCKTKVEIGDDFNISKTLITIADLIMNYCTY